MALLSRSLTITNNNNLYTITRNSCSSMFPSTLRGLSDQEKHDYILKNYVLNKANSVEFRRHKRDIDVIKEHHRFLWDDDADEQAAPASWEERLSRRYYDKLFKEYTIADLTRYKQNKIALRWRTESEVISGKGQFQCGSRKCEERNSLRTWEVNFAYMEQGERRNALVKLRLCPEHSEHLNYTSRKREVKRLKYSEKKQQQAQKKHKDNRSKNESFNESSEVAVHKEIEGHADLPASASSSKEVQSRIEQSDEDNIWSKKPEIEAELPNRETEFERYLEELLL